MADKLSDPEPTAAAITRLLNDGSPEVAAKLLPLVYEELRRLAKSRMRQERSDHTLQATALVHEAYLRLVKESDMRHWDGRGHFFAAAAEAMRRILVENARRRSRLKRGGAMQRINFDEAQLTTSEPPDELLALDEALEAMTEKHPEQAKLVTLRFFAGLTIEEAAQAMNISTSTADRHWTYARAWLTRRMNAS